MFTDDGGVLGLVLSGPISLAFLTIARKSRIGAGVALKRMGWTDAVAGRFRGPSIGTSNTSLHTIE